MGVREVFDRTAEDYDRSRPQLVPCFEQFYGALVEGLPYERDETFSVLDLGAGTGLLSLLISETFPNARLTLVDVAPQMLERARTRFARTPERFRYLLGDYSELPVSGSYDCVVSALSIHHLSDESKRQLFHRVHGWLRAGGVFANADQVAGPTPAADAAQRADWLAQARALGVSEGDLTAALERMKEDRPATVEAQLSWLEQSGFAGVRCVFRQTMFAVFFAVRPAPEDR